MRKLVLSLGLLAGIASTATAQGTPWTGEFGIRSTFGKVDIDDGSLKLTLINIPGGTGFQGIGSNASLYAVFPVGSGRFAIEPGLGFMDQSVAGSTVTLANVSGRLLFSAVGNIYVAGGPSLSLIKIDDEESARFGGQVAAGYRFNISRLRGRAEVFYGTFGDDDEFGVPKSTDLGLAFALGMPVGGETPTRGSRRGESDAMWDLALGVQGGYSHASFPGQLEITTLSLPGNGGEVSFLGAPLPSMAPWFVQIPVGERIAVEPSFGYHSYDEDGGGNGSVMNLGLRANYAFNRTFYAGLSAEMSKFGGDDFDGVDGTTGFGVATGVRFPLIAGLKGRTELTYVVLNGGDSSFLPDGQVTSLAFGITAPIK